MKESKTMSEKEGAGVGAESGGGNRLVLVFYWVQGPLGGDYSRLEEL